MPTSPFTNLHSIDIFVVIAVAVTFAAFIEYLSYYASGYTQASQMCHDIYPKYKRNKEEKGIGFGLLGEKTDEYRTCLDEQEKMFAKAEPQKYTMIVAGGLAGLLASGMTYDQNNVIAIGLGLGGLGNIMHVTFCYWDKMDELYRVGLSGLGLMGSLFLGYKFIGLRGSESTS